MPPASCVVQSCTAFSICDSQSCLLCEQRFAQLMASSGSGEDQGRGAIFSGLLEVCFGIQQQLAYVNPLSMNSMHQCRPPIRVFDIRVGLPLQQNPHHIGAPPGGRSHQSSLPRKAALIHQAIQTDPSSAQQLLHVARLAGEGGGHETLLIRRGGGLDLCICAGRPQFLHQSTGFSGRHVWSHQRCILVASRGRGLADARPRRAPDASHLTSTWCSLGRGATIISHRQRHAGAHLLCVKAITAAHHAKAKELLL
mmetsp:Transcript_102176/g.243662  ORF Transcript_102176/g.243662 Transcript_102176/m.243662 type:complete len:254 (-) Transcript_102176:440-1201(-)